MLPRIKEIAWRGVWLLVVFEKADDPEDIKSLEQSDLKIYWEIIYGLKDSGSGFIDYGTINENYVLLDISESCCFAKFGRATRMTISNGDDIREIEIVEATEKEKEWRTWEDWHLYLDTAHPPS